MSSWNDSLLIGIKLIDEQHRELIGRMDKLMDACRHGKGHDEVEETLKYVVSYVKEHFKDEEALQAKYAYPGMVEHKKLHAGFVDSVVNLLQEDKKTGPSTELTAHVNKTLIGWFITHIRNEDQKLGLCIKRAGGK